MGSNQHIVMRALPQGPLTEEHFELRSGDIPPVAPGEVLIRTILISIDAANRARMKGATYRKAVKLGDVMHASCIGEVAQSNDDRTNGEVLKRGDVVAAEAGWAEYVAVKARSVEGRVEFQVAALTMYGPHS